MSAGVHGARKSCGKVNFAFGKGEAAGAEVTGECAAEEL